MKPGGFCTHWFPLSRVLETRPEREYEYFPTRIPGVGEQALRRLEAETSTRYLRMEPYPGDVVSAVSAAGLT